MRRFARVFFGPLPGLILAATVAPAAAVELPTRKAGLWEMTMLREGATSGLPAMQHCTDAAIDKEMTTIVGNIQEQCSRKDIQKVGDTIVIDSVCSFGGVKSTAHSEITGDFNSAYTVKVTTNIEGGPRPGASTMTFQAKWLSPCLSNQRPGDIIMPGVKFNVQDMLNLRKLLPRQ
jgi:hypothetical protein